MIVLASSISIITTISSSNSSNSSSSRITRGGGGGLSEKAYAAYAYAPDNDITDKLNISNEIIVLAKRS